MKGFWKTHKFPLLTILGIALLVMLFPLRSPHAFFNEMNDYDTGRWLATNAQLIKESILRGEFPLWTSSRLTEPFLHAEPQAGVFSLTTALSLVMSVPAAFKLTFLIYYILAGVGMYLFLRHIKHERVALIGAGAFMLNSSIATLFFGYPFFGLVYTSIPWTLLLMHIGISSKRWHWPAIGIGAIWAACFHAGGVEQLIYVMPLFAAYLAYLTLSPLTVSRLRQGALIGVVMGAVFVGLIAIKLLPGLELVDYSNRAAAGGGFDFQTFLGNHITTQNFIPYLIKDTLPFPMNYDLVGSIGFIGLALLCASLLRIRHKRVLLFWALLIMSILLITESPLTLFLWKFVPIINQTRNVFKALLIFNFVAAALIAFGAQAILEFLDSRSKTIARYERGIALVLIALIMLELGILNYWAVSVGGGLPQYAAFNERFKITHTDVPQAISQMTPLKYLGDQEGIFRFKEASTNTPFGIATSRFNIQFGLEDVYGINNLWYPTYIYMLQIAEQQGAQARYYGLLNVRYLTSTEQSAPPGFRLVFTGELPSDPNPHLFHEHRAAYGPYVYENEQVMPRAQGVQHAILAVGAAASPGGLGEGESLMYQLLLEPTFNGSRVAVALAEGPIERYDQSFLSQFDGIVLAQGATGPGSSPTLQAYKAAGGKLLPDVLEPNPQVTPEQVRAFLSSFADEPVSITYTHRTPGNSVIVPSTTTKFIALAETYSLYEGWHARQEGKELPLMRANGALTLIKPLSSAPITLQYSPRSFTIGLWLTLLTLIAITSIGAYDLWRRK